MTHAALTAATRVPGEPPADTCTGTLMIAGGRIDPTDHHELIEWQCTRCNRRLVEDINTRRIRGEYTPELTIELSNRDRDRVLAALNDDTPQPAEA